MSEQLSQEQAIRAIYGFAAEKMKLGLAPHRIEEELIKKGLEAETAKVVVSRLSQMRSKAIRDAALRNMAIGGVICVIGIVVTVGTFQAAQGGGRYVVAWGAIIFGGIQFFRGLAQLAG